MAKTNKIGKTNERIQAIFAIETLMAKNCHCLEDNSRKVCSTCPVQQEIDVYRTQLGWEREANTGKSFNRWTPKEDKTLIDMAVCKGTPLRDIAAYLGRSDQAIFKRIRILKKDGTYPETKSAKQARGNRLAP